MKANGELPLDERRACGVTGCLYAAVGLFTLMLIGVLILAAIRFSSPPEPRVAPQPQPGMGWATPDHTSAVDPIIGWNHHV
ncbi:hypothetical protein BH23GEM6_BH23GEM6_02840 [soil metagenome]